MSKLTLKSSTGTSFDTYLVGPAEAKCAVLIIHDWWGVLEYNKIWADRFATLGYRAMVVDLYDGERARSVEQAGEMMRALDQDEADAKLSRAIDHLKESGASIVTLGWSLGGRQAMNAALLDPEAVSATVLFYCRMPSDAQQLSVLGGPVLALYAELEQTWPDKMEKFNRAMREAGKEVETHSFQAGHGFVNPTSERHNPEVAEQAWSIVESFVRKHCPC